MVLAAPVVGAGVAGLPWANKEVPQRRKKTTIETIVALDAFLFLFILISAEPTRMFARIPIMISNNSIRTIKETVNGLLKGDGAGGPAAQAGCTPTVKNNIASGRSIQLGLFTINPGIDIFFSFLFVKRDPAHFVKLLLICPQHPYEDTEKKHDENEQRSHPVNVNTTDLFYVMDEFHDDGL
jgi:hypothetical protein